MPRFVVYAALTVGSLFAPAIARGLKAIGDRLYRPPQGRLVLAATCALAIAGVRWAMINRTAPEGLKVAVVIGLPTIALCAMFIARDQYRAARGLPPVRSPSESGGKSPLASASCSATLRIRARSIDCDGPGSWRSSHPQVLTRVPGRTMIVRYVYASAHTGWPYISS